MKIETGFEVETFRLREHPLVYFVPAESSILAKLAEENINQKVRVTITVEVIE